MIRRAGLVAFAEETLLAAHAVLQGFRGERISLRAAALTYISIFSLVPLFTVGLVLVQRLSRGAFEGALTQLIHTVLAPGIQAESSAYLDRYIRSAGSGAAGLGFVLLMFSAGSLLRNLDSSLNEIWNVHRKRSWPVRIATYLLLLILGPPFLALSLTGTSLIRAMLEAHFPVVSRLYWAATWASALVGFTLLYLLAPNAHVRFRAALAGGCVAGTAWELARTLYAAYASRAIRYNPIYGSLGALPFFLLWLYLTWLLVLFGARLAYAVQHARFRGGILELGAHPRARELIAARIAQIATLASAGIEQPQGIHALSARLHVPEATVSDIVGQLVKAGLITADSKGGLVPGRRPETLTLADVSAAVGGFSARLSETSAAKTSEFQEVEPYFALGDEAVLRRLSHVRWSSFLPIAPPPP